MISYRWLLWTLSGLLLGQSEKPLAQWRFDESNGSSVRDSASGTSDKIAGLHRFIGGVAGNSIQFDGYTTHIERPWKQVPAIAAGFTVESWIAVDAYPWNWVPIVDWQRDMQAGYLFGIDPYGRIGLHMGIAGSWNVLSSNRKVPLKRWTHVAATFDPQVGIALYIDGKPAGQLAATGAFTPPEKTDLLVGRTRDKVMPVPSGLIHPKHSVLYSLEAQLDELTIHGRALSASELVSKTALVKVPEGMSSPWPVMPAGSPGPGRFGAYYETLRFQDTWDRPRRVAPASDVVVRFPQSGMRLVFWQGMNYVPAWVTENNKWYTDQFMEVYGKPQCPDGEDCEPMSDKQNRYSHVRILENTDARVVVHWRYALSESENYKAAYQDPLTGWFDWGDEYWTIYPDGVAVRKQVLWSSHLEGVRPGDKVGRAPHEFQESIVLNGPGQWPEDNIHFDALTLANMNGETAVYKWKEKSKELFDYPNGPNSFPDPPEANIQWVNLKSTWKPFSIIPGPALFTAYNGEKTISSFEWWNHWPVGQINSSGRPALAPDRASHTSLSHIYWQSSEATENSVTRLLMDGLTTQSAAELVPLSKSWLNPPAVQVTGLVSEGYQRGERAYLLRRSAAATGAVEITLQGSVESPVVNPAFVIRDWKGGARAWVNGKPAGRLGQRSRLDGDDLIVWLELNVVQPVRIQLSESAN